MSGIRLDGSEIGWQFGQDVSSGSLTLPSFQVTTDLEVNLPLVFETYLPRLVVDFGTASGASSVLFAKLMGEYAGNGRVLTVDLNDPMKGPHGKSFERALDNLPITSHVGDALASETKEVVKAFLESRQEEVALLSFDDDHSAGHVLRELETYSSLLRPRDVIVVQDTWDQGFRDTPLTALLGVLRFLKENTFFELDVGLLRRVALPCSFVHGVIVMKGTGSHDSGRILPGGRETLS
jgi:cephalosporin hydroxylase